MALTDPLGTPLSEELLTCLCQEIALVENPPTKCCIRTGSVVPWLMSLTKDECCAGLAWVRIVNIVPGFPEPVENVPVGNDVLQWAVELEMGVIRCGPFSELVPSCDEWTASTREVNDDAAAMRRAMCCFIEGTHREPVSRPRKGSVLPGIWEPLEMSGGCAGGTMLMTVRGTPCLCPDEVS